MKKLYLVLCMVICFGIRGAQRPSSSSSPRLISHVIVSQRMLHLCRICEDQRDSIFNGPRTLCSNCLSLVGMNTRVRITVRKIMSPGRTSFNEERTLEAPIGLLTSSDVSPPSLSDDDDSDDDYIPPQSLASSSSSPTRHSPRLEKRKSSSSPSSSSSSRLKKKRKKNK